MKASKKSAAVAAQTPAAGSAPAAPRKPRSRSGSASPDELRTDQPPKLPNARGATQAVLNAISSPMALVNSEGILLEMNAAWRSRAAAQSLPLLAIAKPGGNYRDKCRTAGRNGLKAAAEADDSLRVVLTGATTRSEFHYCHVDEEGRDHWYTFRATALPGGTGATLVHEETTMHRQLEREILEISERERRQVGQELHDGLCQHLSGVSMLARTLANSLASAERPESERALELSSLLHSAVGQIRAVARGLRPVEFDANGLTAALQELAHQISDRVPCEFRCRQEVSVPDNEVATNLYRIAQEAVTNAVRHGRPQRIVVTLKASAKGLMLLVEDDGAGLPVNGEGDRGMGVKIMRYRASSIGASFEVANRPSGGARVQCCVPLPPRK